MADVRLTATNPADSSVVPVACNEKGELKLEEIPDQSFDGNLEGDLTVSGSAEFASTVTAPFFSVSDGSFGVNNIYASLQNTGDSARLFMSNTDALGADEAVIDITKGESGTEVFRVNASGSATFANTVTLGSGLAPIATEAIIAYNSTVNATFYGRNSTSGAVFQAASNAGIGATINGEGSAKFAGNKAGFTAEGYLWCTTRRGDTVMLDVTSNGLASWVPYTPPNRLTELQDRWAEKDGILPVPHDSSQDEPETTQ